MNIYFYNVKDDRRALVKTLINTGAGANLKTTLTGHLKDDCGILDPVIEVAYNADILTSNYMYIPAFERYYFINNMTTSMQRLFIAAHVDVLMSYHDEIDMLNCVIERQEHTGRCDEYINDRAYMSEARFNIRTIPFPHGFNKSSSSFVLTTGGES